MPSSSLQGFGTTVDRQQGRGQPTPVPSPTATPAGGLRSVLVGLGAAAALGVGGLLAYRLVGAAPQPLPPQPAALTIAPPITAFPAAEPRPRTVKLVVLPGDATVEVDGTNVTPSDGAVEITGALGSVHKVRLKSGDAEVVRDVAISEAGALPFKIELPAPSAPAPAPSAPAPRPPVVKGPFLKSTAPPTALPLRQQR
jgi:serine/threonine-protein kinase